jgi:hypothetical protein
MDDMNTNYPNNVGSTNNFNYPANSIDEPQKKNSTARTVIIVISTIVGVATLAIVGFIIWLFAPAFREPAHKLTTDKAVIAHLENKYPGDSFEVVSKKETKWTIKSTKSNISFGITEVQGSSSGGLTRGNYELRDDYVDTIREKVVKNFSSSYITIKNESSGKLVLYGANNLNKKLDASEMTGTIKSEIYRLCKELNKTYPFDTNAAVKDGRFRTKVGDGQYLMGDPFPALSLEYYDQSVDDYYYRTKYLYCYPSTSSFEEMKK